MNKSMLQRILHRNKILITVMLEAQASLKKLKSYADENNFLETEYLAHNKLKSIRAEIAKLVNEQKAIKAIVNSKG